MRVLSIVRLRLRSLFSRTRVEEELEEELRYHLARQVEEDIAAGMTHEEARRAAIRSAAGVEQRKEECRDARGVSLIDNLVQDARFAGRQLAKSPGFTFTAVLMLALGMAASVAIFGFVDAALIRSLPYRNPSRLVSVTETTPEIPRANLSYPDYLDWKRLNSVFSSMDVHVGRGSLLRTATGTELVSGARVSGGFFRTLAVVPALGRDFFAGEDLPDAPDTVILSHAAWQKRFGARGDVIGQTVTLNAVPHTIVGVLPHDFQFAPRERAEFWTTLRPVAGCDLRRSCHHLRGIGRLKDDVSIPAALAEMKTLASQLETQFPDSNRGQGAIVEPLSEVIVGDIRPILLVLLAGAGLLLLIACVNVASLLLVRAESRTRELAVRTALGASRGRLIRQFVTEGLVLVAAGGGLGLACASWAMQLLVRLIPADMMKGMPYLDGLGLNWRVVACAAAIAVVATIVFSTTPVLRLSSSKAGMGIAAGSRGSSGNTWHRLGFKLVVLELATATVLLAGAGLLGKSLYRLLDVELGFQPDHLATLQIVVPRSYATDERVVALGRQIVSRAAGLPGVESAGIASVLPVSFNGNTDWIRFVGRPYNGEHNEVNQRDVSPEYFRALRAKLMRGRFFTDADAASKTRVVIINRTLARRYFPNEDPIGKHFGDTSLSTNSIKEIVGVVDDIKEGALDSEIWPAVYYPFEQDPDTSFSIVVRSSQTDPSVLSTLQAEIHRIDPDIGTARGATMSDRITDSPIAYLRRSSAWLIGGFAAVALLLGAIGLYGVVAYSVSQRTREIGIRLAMGAQRGSVHHLILREAARVTTIGILLGLVCAVAGATLMRNLLFSTPPWDMPTLAAVAAVLGLSALLASYIPARRAASVDPVEALRAE
jgi:predicted permease